MKNTNRFLFMLLAVLFLTAAGCSKKCGSTPEKAAEKYLKAFFKNDLDKTWNCASIRDRNVEKKESYEAMNRVEPDSVVARLVSKAEVKVVDVKHEGYSTVAVAAVTTARVDMVIEDMLGFAFNSASEGMSYGEFDRALKDRYANAKVPKGTSPVILFLVKEADDWKVYHGWETQKALELERWEKFDEALDIWEWVNRIIPDHPEAQKRIDAIKEKMAERG